jgi:hypothetical protein
MKITDFFARGKSKGWMFSEIRQKNSSPEWKVYDFKSQLITGRLTYIKNPCTIEIQGFIFGNKILPVRILNILPVLIKIFCIK